MRKLPLYLIGGGTTSLALFLSLCLGGFEKTINWSIVKNGRLRVGSEAYELWRDPQVPTFVKHFFFNVTNPEEARSGGKLRVKEVGPYTYEEKIFKQNIVRAKLNDTLEFNEVRSYYFRPNMSKRGRRESDILTLLNIPLMAVSNSLQEISDLDYSSFETNLTESGETLFKRLSVKDFLFGSPAKAYQDLSSNLEGFELPETLGNGQFGLYEEKNGTLDPNRYMVFAGMVIWERMRVYWKMNNMTSMPWWKSENCSGGINGTDGTFFRPFTTNTSTLKWFLPEACRTLDLTYSGPVEYFKSGVPGLRFTQDPGAFQGIGKNPENECFCTMKNCDRNGLISLNECPSNNKGLGLFLSQAHFLNSDPDIVEGVVRPDPEKHETYFDIEPITGGLLKSVQRFQLNIDVKAHPKLPSLGTPMTATYPILWTERILEFPESYFKFYKITLEMGRIADESKFTLIMISLSALVFGLILAIILRDKQERIKLTKG